MEALFQIGKDLGTLSARVTALEAKGCNCGSKSTAVAPSTLPQRQRETLMRLRRNHKEVFTRINDILRQFDVKVTMVRMVDMDVPRPAAGSDECCYCCSNDDVSGWDYCCSDDCSPCCA